MAEYIDREALLQDIEQSVVFSARTGTESAEMRAARKIVDRIRMAPSLITLTPPNEPLIPCDLCRYNLPSSCDGKPCCMCPAKAAPPEEEANV